MTKLLVTTMSTKKGSVKEDIIEWTRDKIQFIASAEKLFYESK